MQPHCHPDLTGSHLYFIIQTFFQFPMCFWEFPGKCHTNPWMVFPQRINEEQWRTFIWSEGLEKRIKEDSEGCVEAFAWDTIPEAVELLIRRSSHCIYPPPPKFRAESITSWSRSLYTEAPGLCLVSLWRAHTCSHTPPMSIHIPHIDTICKYDIFLQEYTSSARLLRANGEKNPGNRKASIFPVMSQPDKAETLLHRGLWWFWCSRPPNILLKPYLDFPVSSSSRMLWASQILFLYDKVKSWQSMTPEGTGWELNDFAQCNVFGVEKQLYWNNLNLVLPTQ